MKRPQAKFHADTEGSPSY